MRCEMVRRDVESVSRNASLGIIIHSNSWHSHQAALRAAWWLCQLLE